MTSVDDPARPNRLVAYGKACVAHRNVFGAPAALGAAVDAFADRRAVLAKALRHAEAGGGLRGLVGPLAVDALRPVRQRRQRLAVAAPQQVAAPEHVAQILERLARSARAEGGGLLREWSEGAQPDGTFPVR